MPGNRTDKIERKSNHDWMEHNIILALEAGFTKDEIMSSEMFKYYVKNDLDKLHYLGGYIDTMIQIFNKR